YVFSIWSKHDATTTMVPAWSGKHGRCRGRSTVANIFEGSESQSARTQETELSLADYLHLAERPPMADPSSAVRPVVAVGQPELIDTRNDPRLSRLFGNRVIKRYPAFNEFYGMEDAISQIVAFFKHAAQGLEERKQILYLLGPVGGGKSSIAERLKLLMEQYP